MKIHNGKLFFDGTQILIRGTLEQFAHGKNIDQITDTLQGKVSKEEVANAFQQAIETMCEISRDAIVEALNLSINALEQFHSKGNK